MNNNNFDRSDKYRHEDFSEYYSMYRIAKEIGDKELERTYANLIHEFIKRFVYSILWERYSGIMKNPLHSQELSQSVFELIYSKLFSDDPKVMFHPEKATITVYLMPWIKHSVQVYCAKNFRNTTTHYANAMNKVSAARDMCAQYSIAPTFENIVKFTGLPEATCAQAIDLLEKKDITSIESLGDNGYEHESGIQSPEQYVIESEDHEVMADFMKRCLTEEEIMVLDFLINPLDSDRSKASYREIAARMTDLGYDYNIPKVKRIISRVTQLMKKDKKMKKHFGGSYGFYDPIKKNKVHKLDDNDIIEEQRSDFRIHCKEY